MHRRSYLRSVAAGAVVIGGCLQRERENGAAGGETVPGRLLMEGIEDSQLARRLSYGMDDGPERMRRLAERLVRDGSLTVQGSEPPLRNVERIHHDGTVYEVSRDHRVEQTGTEYGVELSAVEGSVSAAETVAYADLPAVDREKLAVSEELIGTGTRLRYTDAERERSALVPTPVHPVIVWDGGAHRTRLTVTDSESVTIRATYRYEATAVGTVEAVGATIRQQHAFALSDVTSEERALLREAIERKGGYRLITSGESGGSATAFERLVERFRPHRSKRLGDETDRERSGVSGTYLVQFDGETYWTELSVDEDELA